jgi:hypothetical protein
MLNLAFQNFDGKSAKQDNELCPLRFECEPEAVPHVLAAGNNCENRLTVKQRLCLAPLEGSGSGDFGDEAGGTLDTGGGQRSEDLPGSGAFLGFVTTGDLACDHCGAQLAFSQVVSGFNAIVIQKGQEMIALFIEPIAYGFFVRFAAGKLQQLRGFVFEGLAQLTEGCQIKVGFLLLECDGGAQQGRHFA